MSVRFWVVSGVAKRLRHRRHLCVRAYPTIVARFDAAIADRGDVEKQALWHDTAAHIYRIAEER